MKPEPSCPIRSDAALTVGPPMSWMSTLDLIQHIVTDADRDALVELVHHRRGCVVGKKKGVSLGEFLLLLRDNSRRTRRLPSEVVEIAYDLTVDKFTRLPVPPPDHPNDDGIEDSPPARSGPLCIPYYRAILRHCEKRHGGSTSHLADEAAVAWQLQTFVVRHFDFSLKEAKRIANCGVHRYVWQIKGKKLSLCMPLYQTGNQKREWLEKHVQNVNPGMPGERERVQGIIDQRLSREPGGLIEAGDYGIGAHSLRQRFPSILDSPAQRNLVEALAEEKAEEINNQRRSIAQLGGDRLKQLIRDIFEGLSEDKYSERALAKTYGLSSSTFSRFAGSRWTIADREPKRSIPDLWRNLAGLLAGCETFREAAKRAGVWGVVDSLINEEPVPRRSGATQGEPR